VRGLLGDWTHRAALVNSLLLARWSASRHGARLRVRTARRAANLPRWSGARSTPSAAALISPPFTAAIALIFALGPAG